MQQIEKYGVIALVFLLVTIVAVSFWGDSKSPGFWSRLTGGSKTEVAQTPEQPVNAAGEPGVLVGGGAVVNADAPVANDPFLKSNELTAPGEVTIGNAFDAQGNPVAWTAPTNKGQETTYTVKSGDSLAKIARKELGSETRWNEIAQLNPGLNAKNLKVGQSILLPTGTATASTVVADSTQTAPVTAAAPKPVVAKPVAAKPAAAPKSKGGRTYVVKSGDTLAKIAARECGTSKAATQIAALNPNINPDRIKVGDKLVLPATSEKSLVAAAAPASSRSSKSKVQ
jgi:nucleoid-associated protein YgaU